MNFLRKIGILPLVALIVVLVVLFGRLGELPFRDPDEGRNSEVAREMHQSGAWLVPTYDGLTYLDKPAFFFKAVALSYSLFGESEAAARFPSAFFALLLLGMLYAFCRREYPGTPTASLAVMIAATSPLFLALARHVIFDMTLAFFVSAAIFCAYLAESTSGRDRSRWYLLGAVSAGFATLVKGPVGFLIPLLVIAVYNQVEGRKGWARRGFSLWNILAFFAVVLPWFIGLSLECPDFPYYGLVEESFHRFTTTSFQRSGPFYYYGLVLLGGLFAWSLLLPEAVARTWRNRTKLSSADRFFITWSIVVVLFFSISKSKLPAYILTATIALGTLTARLFVAALAHRSGTAARLIFRGLLVLILFSLVVALLLSRESFHPGTYDRWGFHGTEFHHLLPLFAPAASALFFVTLIASVAFWRRDVRLVFATFLLLPLLLLTVVFAGLLQYSETSSSRPIALGILPLPPGTQVVCFECFPPGLPFYLKQNVTLVSRDGSELTSNYVTFTLKKTKPWPAIIVPRDEWNQWRESATQPLFLLTNNGNRGILNALVPGTEIEFREVAPGWWGALIPPRSK